MLKRKMENTLARWKQSGAHDAFLLVGARQTGKTFVVRQFAQHNYKNFIELNFLENKQAAAILSQATDTDDFISRLSLITQTPRNTEDTLLFLDEIQEAPDILTTIKFLVEDGRFHIAISGSLLGAALKGVRSFPVGYIQIHRMFPLDFEEFCWARDVSQAIIDDIKHACANKTALDDALHNQLISLFRYYVAVGGMPQVVQTYFDSEFNMSNVRATAQQIVEQYRYDIIKYADTTSAPHILSLFDAIPSQLDKVNKRFRMDAVGKNASFKRYADDFNWLIDAGVALPAYLVTEPKYPLKRTELQNKFKLYLSDTGLLLSQYPPQVSVDVIQNASSVNFGAVYENAVAMALSSASSSLYYYANNRKGEIDFLTELNNGDILPVEVKSGKDYKLHTALNNLLGSEEYNIENAIVLTMDNMRLAKRYNKTIVYMPLYMAFCIAEQANGKLPSVKLIPPSI